MSFDVIVVGGPSAGVSTLVHAMVGQTARSCDNSPGVFSVATRLVQVDGATAVLKLWEVAAAPDLDLPREFRADAVIAVFNADRRQSLNETLTRYRELPPAPIRFLVGNVHRHRALDDTCEFLEDVDRAAASLGMDACLLSAHAPSAQTKVFVDCLARRLIHGSPN